jgi:hypothetical protein
MRRRQIGQRPVLQMKFVFKAHLFPSRATPERASGLAPIEDAVLRLKRSRKGASRRHPLGRSEASRVPGPGPTALVLVTPGGGSDLFC